MGNTIFYNKAKYNANSITWKDVFSECRKKHSKRELEYALQAGTSFNTATEGDMLQKWQKPWLFFPLLKGGLILWAFIYVLFFATNILSDGAIATSLYEMTMIIPPMIIPMIILVFIWELNVPKNISIYELLAYFLIGGFLTFAVTSLTFNIIGDGPGIFYASYAAFREEPAKLIPAILIIVYFVNIRKKKLYGVSGLVIGAAVGAGFGIFESISYAFNSGGVQGAFINQVMRGIFSLGGHILYAAPYSAALALAIRKKGKLTWSCLIDRDFLLTFFASVIIHFIWNANIGGTLFAYLKYVALIVVLWIILLYIVRKCLNEMVFVGTYYSGQGDNVGAIPVDGGIAIPSSIRIICVAGALRGAIWQSEGSEVLYMGRESGNQFRFPPNTPGISRFHCSIQKTQKGWSVKDNNSSYGTYINGGNKLVPGIDRVLKDGDILYIGSNENAFQVKFF